jgi:Putative peptidoglycan binding domain
MFDMKTIIPLAISSVLFLLSESLIAGDRGGGVGFPVPPQQTLNPAPSQPAASRTPVTRAPRPKRGPHLPGGGNGNVQPGNGNPAQPSQGPVAQGGPNRHPDQNGNQNPNQHHHQKPGNNPHKPPITSATPPPPRHDWHDGDWYRHHCPVIVIVVGNYYYWDAGYWYPAYGYDPTNYYPSDGPVYAYGNLLPDQVIANVQRQLQVVGYYAGAITGSLDSTTRAAIANYQRDNGLLVTGTVDQSTVESLGLV